MVLSVRSESIPPSSGAKSLAIGSRVAGRYRVVALLHSDGSGLARVAVDERPDAARRLVVLEMLRGDPAPTSAAIEAFIHDARWRERMNHPNVLETYELVQHDGLPVLVSEYVEGESLATLLALAFGLPEFSLEVRLTILAYAVRGLAYIHQLGAGTGRPQTLVHANISPHEIVVAYDGRVKLAGFGSTAQGARRRSKPALAPANLEYLAPERLHESQQPSSDVFSAGVLLWELVALQRFWNDLPEYEVRRRLQAFDIPDIARLKPLVAGELGRICRQALAPDPARRHPSAVELASELERFLITRSAVAAPASIALVMKNACSALQHEARQLLDSALDAAAGPRRSESLTDAGIWHVLTKERPLSRSPLPRAAAVAWVAGALVALSIAIVTQRTPSAPQPNGARSMSLDPVSRGSVPLEALPPAEGAAPLDGPTRVTPEHPSSTTTIQTLRPDPPRRAPASFKPVLAPVPERRRPAERARRARRLGESTQIQPLDAAAGAPSEAPALTIRLER